MKDLGLPRYGSLSELSNALSVDTSLRKRIIQLTLQYFGEHVTGNCKNKLHDAYLRLMKLTSDKMERNFELPAGMILYDRSSSKTVGHSGLTDELALYHLSKDRRNIHAFSKVPANWEQLLSEYEKRRGVAVKEEPIKPTEAAIVRQEKRAPKMVTEEGKPEEEPFQLADESQRTEG